MTSRLRGKDRPSEDRRTYMEEILILQMGGTIDKDYPKTRKGYAFEIEGPASRRILNRLRPGKSILVVHDTVCRKDSLEIGDQERSKLLEMALAAPQRRILVTHGTDTLIQTALWLQQELQNYVGSNSRLVVVTGAFTPERMKDSDADFNIGVAVGALQSLPTSGNSRVFVAMNGLVCPCEAMERDLDTGQFIPSRRPRSRDFSQRPRSSEVKPRQTETKQRSQEQATRAPEVPPRTREHSYSRQRSLESLLDPRPEPGERSLLEPPENSHNTGSQPRPAPRQTNTAPPIDDNSNQAKRAVASMERMRHLYNRPRSDGWEPRDEVKQRHLAFRASLDHSRYSKLFDNTLTVPEDSHSARGNDSHSARNLALERQLRMYDSTARGVTRDDSFDSRQSRGHYIRRDPYRDSIGSRSDSGLYLPSHDDSLESQLSLGGYSSSGSQRPRHLMLPDSNSSSSSCRVSPASNTSLGLHDSGPPPLPITSPPAVLPSPPPPTAEQAEAVFTASLQYLLHQRAQSYPLLQSPPPVPPRPPKFASSAHAPRREPEINSDPSLPESTPPTRRSAVRTNGSLVVTSTGNTANHSPLRRCTAVSQLDMKAENHSNDSEINEDDSNDENEVETTDEVHEESPLAAEKRTGARRTLPPGWRHQSQRPLADVVEEEELHAGRLGPRSMLRRLSEGPGMQLRENINEEYL